MITVLIITFEFSNYIIWRICQFTDISEHLAIYAVDEFECVIDSAISKISK